MSAGAVNGRGFGLAAILFAATATAQTSPDSGTIIPLYARGAVASLGVPEIRERRDGDLVIRNVSEPTLGLFRPAPGRANGTAVIWRVAVRNM